MIKLEIIDNFLQASDFKKISKVALEKIGKKDIKVYHNSIVKNKVLNSECINSDFLIELNKKYHLKAMNILQKLNKEKVKLYDYSEFHIIETGANCSFPIHDDTPNKLLSGVIYLKPNKNYGTSFFSSKNGKSKKTISWKLNRAVFFSRKERESWHSYQGDGKSNRIVLVYNLMTKNIKGALKAEKKSYFVGNLRYKLNPYIYKFFKKTI
tara:strand:+ start:129 stop:758 length:630 start_codon:yes stop_codon:yes gene_type:complete